MVGVMPGILISAGQPELQDSPQGSRAHSTAPRAGSPLLPFSFHRAVRALSQSQSQSQRGNPGPHLTPTHSLHGAIGIFGSDVLSAEPVLLCRG